MRLISENELKEFRHYLEFFKSLSPLADEVLEVVFSYTPVLKKLAEGFSDFYVDNTVRAIERYKQAGFTQQEAMLLAINSRIAFGEMLSNYQNVVSIKKT